MHYYQHNIGDYAIATKYMSFTEKGVYVDLVDHYLATGKPLDSHWLAIFKRAAGEGAVDTVLTLCFEERGGLFYNDELDKMLKAYAQTVEKNRSNAQKRRKESTSNATGNPVASQSLPSGKPMGSLTNNHKPITNKEIQKKSSAPAEKHEVFHCPEGIKPEAWEAWMQVRKAKKAGAMTAYAWSRFCATAKRAGLTPAGAVDFCVDHAWQGLNAEWLKDKDLSKYQAAAASLGTGSDEDRVHAALQRSLERRRQETLL